MLRAVGLCTMFRFGYFLLSFMAALPAFAAPAATGHRIHFTPHFVAGQVFHYSVQMHIDSASHYTGPITDPEGPTKLGESVSVVLRLEVLSVGSTAAAPGSVRLRATYEKAAATSSSDSYDADAAAREAQYKKLEGKSIEFTLAPDGKITSVTGLDSVVSDRSRAAMIAQWLDQLTLSASAPKAGIAIGEKWFSEQPIENVPLAGLVWRTESTYARNEACPAVRSEPASGAAAAPVTPPSASDECAVILTHSKITGAAVEKDSPEKAPKDRTPDAFRKNGLRTFGEWTGAGDSLTAISLRTGMVVSVTQTGTTHMDFTIMTAIGRNRMRYAGDTQSQSEITLLSQSVIP